MSTCTVSKQEAFPVAGYNQCWEWVTSLPEETEAPLAQVDQQERQHDISNDSSSILVGRRHGVLGVQFGGRNNAADIYQLAQATRKARERFSSTELPSRRNSVQVDQRAVMLRTAYAAQKMDRRAHSDGTLSFDSSFDPFSLTDEDDCFPTAEEILLELGFGGPVLGVGRVPQRFLQPSQMRGVSIDQYFAIEQELEETFDTGSLGYRGLSGPPTRRPSSIVACLYERMLRKNSVPTATSSFEHPSLVLPLKIVTDQEETENSQDGPATPTNQQMLSVTNLSFSLGGSRRTSPTSSRRSSLRKQDCFEVEMLIREEINNQPDTQAVAAEDETDDSNGSSGSIETSHPGHMKPETASLLTVFVTPPSIPNLVQNSVYEPVVGSNHEIDSILAFLQLASEAFRVQLDLPPVSSEQLCDMNHNLADLKEELRRELDKTDSLVQGLRERLCYDRSSRSEPYDPPSLRSILIDMFQLLQQQQRLYEQANGSPEQCMEHEEAQSITAPKDNDNTDELQLTVAWLKKFERRLTVSVRKTVRHELNRVRRSRKSRRVK